MRSRGVGVVNIDFAPTAAAVPSDVSDLRSLLPASDVSPRMAGLATGTGDPKDCVPACSRSEQAEAFTGRRSLGRLSCRHGQRPDRLAVTVTGAARDSGLAGPAVAAWPWPSCFHGESFSSMTDPAA